MMATAGPYNLEHHHTSLRNLGLSPTGSNYHYPLPPKKKKKKKGFILSPGWQNARGLSRERPPPQNPDLRLHSSQARPDWEPDPQFIL